MSSSARGAKVRYAYRLRMSATAKALLLAEWDRCRWVWNQCVAASDAAHRTSITTGVKLECGPAQLDKLLTGWRAEHQWLSDGSSVAQQQTIRDFGRARTKALSDRKDKRLSPRQRRGLPKFKSKHRAAPSLNYTLRGFVLDGRVIRLAGGIVVRPLWSRELPAAPSSIRVYRDALDRWWCSFVVTRPDTELLPTTGQSIGIDWGVVDLAVTTSANHDLEHPQHGRAAAARLTRYQRMMARRKPARGAVPSRGYKAAKRAAAKQHAHVAAQRVDTGRKWAKSIVTDFDQIAVENFRPKFLARSRTARKAADGAIAATKRGLIEQADKHGRDLVLVDPKYTTTDCSSCGARAKHLLPLSKRIYRCDYCGNVAPRDKNSASVIRNRAGFVPAGVDGIRPERSPSGQAA
ncbi:RNA-guided endonuclease InsQ/TnpB family protein [Mycolicibacterium sphagni]|uniref:Transposase n=1 Tax=Mycolicibacterium sphagni TaxID=1786 RepID=A0A255DDH3_9MYCO|nr:RNA-guided endonuclease TnpB family protein [Mycolicibacterium sphagni]MCV7174492.1 transposase [Mycolicibacterium sphagni]OYN75295.1 transposase [Mycolicibacterium sphagni]